MTRTPWPQAGEVQLYTLVLPHDPADLSPLRATLTAGEVARGDALKSALARRRFVAGRAILREILGGYLGLEANQVQLTAGPHGKPTLPAGKDLLHFNLAHSGDLLLLAVTTQGEVGADIERIDPNKPFASMAKLVFSPGEQEQLLRPAAPARVEAFYRYWVRKEACLKGCGWGFALAGGSFELSPSARFPGVLLACCDQRHWQVMDIELAPGYAAALAVESLDVSQSPPVMVRVDHPWSVC